MKVFSNPFQKLTAFTGVKNARPSFQAPPAQADRVEIRFGNQNEEENEVSWGFDYGMGYESLRELGKMPDPSKYSLQNLQDLKVAETSLSRAKATAQRELGKYDVNVTGINLSLAKVYQHYRNYHLSLANGENAEANLKKAGDNFNKVAELFNESLVIARSALEEEMELLPQAGDEEEAWEAIDELSGQLHDVLQDAVAFYKDAGDVAMAEKLLNDDARFVELTLGRDHTAFADSLLMQGDLYLQTLANSGEDNDEILDLLKNRGVKNPDVEQRADMAVAKYNQAEKLLLNKVGMGDEVSEDAEANFDEDDFPEEHNAQVSKEVADTLSAMAYNLVDYLGKRNAEDARRYLESASDLYEDNAELDPSCEDSLQWTHAQLAGAHLLIAEKQVEKGDLVKAEVHRQQADLIFSESLPKMLGNTREAVNAAGRFHRRWTDACLHAKQYGKAASHFKTLIDMESFSHGAKSPQVKALRKQFVDRALRPLAQALIDEKKYAEAKPVYEDLLEQEIAIKGENHSDIAHLRRDYADWVLSRVPGLETEAACQRELSGVILRYNARKTTAVIQSPPLPQT